MRPLRKQQCSACVAKVMEGDIRQPCHLQKWFDGGRCGEDRDAAVARDARGFSGYCGRQSRTSRREVCLVGSDRVLVVGGGGFYGRYLVEDLAQFTSASIVVASRNPPPVSRG